MIAVDTNVLLCFLLAPVDDLNPPLASESGG